MTEGIRALELEFVKLNADVPVYESIKLNADVLGYASIRALTNAYEDRLRYDLWRERCRCAALKRWRKVRRALKHVENCKGR